MVERHRMVDAQKLVGIESAQDQVGVGDGGLGAAAAVTDRTGPRARALRPDPQHARRIDRGDGAAARADRVHVDHRHMDRHGIFEFELARDLRHGVLDQPDIGGGAAHVVGNQVGMARGAAGIGRRHHARGRAGHHRVDRRLGDQLRRDGAAIALHHQQVAIVALGLQLRAQPRQVAVEDGLDRGVHRRRHAALVLAILRQDDVTRRDIGVGPEPAHDLGGAPLVRRVDVAVQEMDDDRLAACRQKLARGVGHRGLVERGQHLAVGIHALGHFEPHLTVDHRPEGAAQSVGLRPCATTEFEHVAKTLGRDEPDLGDLAFEQRVGGRRRAVDDRLQERRIEAGGRQCGHEADRLVLDGGRHLGQPHLVRGGIDRQQVGESAADIDADGEGALGRHVFKPKDIVRGGNRWPPARPSSRRSGSGLSR